MRILGIDPGVAIVGFGLIESERGSVRMLQYGAVTTPAGLPLATRLVQIENDMTELIRQLKPDEIAIEELFFSKNITTGIAVAHARGVILYTAERLHLPIRLSDGGDFENAEQVRACIAAARRHPNVQAILYTKRIELLPELVDRPANLHARCSAWEGDEAGEAEARRLGFDVTHVVWDGTGNCPYQKSLARLLARKHEIARALRAQGIDAKTANRRAERETETEITVWHCRNCAEHGCGCCGTGDIRFNVVGEGDWALKAERKSDERRN